MRVYQRDNFSRAFRASLVDLIRYPEFETKPRDLSIKENANTVLIIEEPLSCLFTTPTRSSQKKYIAAELMWYFMGRNDAEFITKYAKFWDTIKNPDGTVNSSYGKLLFSNLNEHGITQYEWAISALVKDRDSRQAVMHFNLPRHQYHFNKDFVCTMYGNFQIRDNKLNFTISMRSNDVIWGLPTDIAFFAILQSQALSHLRKYYPDLDLGTYTHIANSFHVYEHHFDAVNAMIDSLEWKSETIPPVGADLINPVGEPTPELISFFSDFANPDPKLLEDPLFSWIYRNINKI